MGAEWNPSKSGNFAKTDINFTHILLWLTLTFLQVFLFDYVLYQIENMETVTQNRAEREIFCIFAPKNFWSPLIPALFFFDPPFSEPQKILIPPWFAQPPPPEYLWTLPYTHIDNPT